MFRFLLGLIYVQYSLFQSSKSVSVLSSFNQSCSNDVACINPLICSNNNLCTCHNVSSFWSEKQNSCLTCLSGWIQWKTNRCLLLAVPSDNGVSYYQANHICHSVSANILHINHKDDFQEFEFEINRLLHTTFSSLVAIFLHLGAWINKLHSNTIKEIENILCDENDINLNDKCLLIKSNNLTNQTLCLSRLECNEQMLFICDMEAIPENHTLNYDNTLISSRVIGALIGAVAPLAMDLFGNVLSGNKQPVPQPQPQPQPLPPIIIQQDSGSPSRPLAQEKSSSDNTLLYVGLGIGGFIILLILIGGVFAIIVLTGCMKNSTSTPNMNYRSSVESDY